MRINMRAAEAKRLAAELYEGASKPLTEIDAAEARAALDLEWWLTSPRVEGASEDRHRAALALYAAIGRYAGLLLGEHSFPAVFDFEGGKMRSDKGSIKAFLDPDNAILQSRMMGAQLVFDLTEAGRAKLVRTTS